MRRLSLATKPSRASEHEAHINYRNMLLLHRFRHKLNQFEQVNVQELLQFYMKLAFPAYIGRKPASLARGDW